MRIRIVRKRPDEVVPVSSAIVPATTADRVSAPLPRETHVSAVAARHSQIILEVGVPSLAVADSLLTRQTFEQALDTERRKFAAASQYLLDLLDPRIRAQAKEYLDAMLLTWDDLEAEKRSLEGNPRTRPAATTDTIAGQLLGLHRLLGLR